MLHKLLRPRRATAAVFATVAILSGACSLGELEPFKKQYDLFRSIKNGMTEQEVREKLGQPNYVYDQGVSPDKYCVRNWTCEKRAISHRLLIYRGGKPILYVYFDGTNRVEHVFIGGS